MPSETISTVSEVHTFGTPHKSDHFLTHFLTKIVGTHMRTNEKDKPLIQQVVSTSSYANEGTARHILLILSGTKCHRHLCFIKRAADA